MQWSWGSWNGWHILRVEVRTVFELVLAAVAYLWLPNGSLPRAASLWGGGFGCSAVSLVCELIVCGHVCWCIVCVLVFAFGLISTAEFRDSSSSERERGRVSKM